MTEDNYEMSDLSGGGTKGDKLDFYQRMFNLNSDLEREKAKFKEDSAVVEDDFGDLIDKDTRKSLKKLASLMAKQKLFEFESESNEIIELKNELNILQGE